MKYHLPALFLLVACLTAVPSRAGEAPVSLRAGETPASLVGTTLARVEGDILVGLPGNGEALAEAAASVGKIPVNIVRVAGNPDKIWGPDAMPIGVPPGTTAMQAVKLAGLERLLTDSAILQIWFPPARTEENTVTPPQMLDVGAVRAGTAKDVVLTMPVRPRVLDSVEITHKDFHFKGGTPDEFITAMNAHFGLGWNNVQIPAALANVRIPAFSKIESKDESTGTGCNPISTLLLYNTISKRLPAMGEWKWEGDVLKPEFVLLAPKTAQAPRAAFAVKTIGLGNAPMSGGGSLRSVYRDDFPALLAGIQEVKDSTNAYFQREGAELLEGESRIQEQTGILVVTGTPAYIDMVESYVTTFRQYPPRFLDSRETGRGRATAPASTSRGGVRQPPPSDTPSSP